MSTDNLNDPTNLDNNDLDYNNPYRPWANVVRGRCTCTANIYAIQEELIPNKKTAINSEDIAKSLNQRNPLRQTKAIQMSSNIKYIPIQFNTSTLMETFCSEPLQVNDYSVPFLPDFRKRRRIYYDYTYISFLNLPWEADEEAITDFVQQYATVVGNPRYPVQSFDGIEYMTGTRVYRVH